MVISIYVYIGQKGKIISREKLENSFVHLVYSIKKDIFGNIIQKCIKKLGFPIDLFV